MRYSDSYDVETDEGLARVRPMDVLLSTAGMVPRERWQTCPECGKPCPLFFGDPDGKHWCAVCQVKREHPEIDS